MYEQMSTYLNHSSFKHQLTIYNIEKKSHKPVFCFLLFKVIYYIIIYIIVPQVDDSKNLSIQLLSRLTCMHAACVFH
jgi:hypothetical protein